jgi:PTS system nitrogen regulatory IIA component
LKLIDLIPEDGVVLDMKALTKDEVIEKISKQATHFIADMDSDEMLKVISEREALGSTAIGGGIAIPHAKIPGLDNLLMLMIRSLNGVPFGSKDNRPVHVLILLLAPDTMVTVYLKALANIARMLKTPGIYQKIMESKDKTTLRKLITGYNTDI